MILRDFPDIKPPPRVALASSASNDPGTCSQLAARWGRENVLVLGRARRTVFEPYEQLLSIKRCWGGSEHFFVDGRLLTIDDERLLVLNDGTMAGSRIDSLWPVTSFALFFRPQLAAQLNAALMQDVRQMLDHGHEAPRLGIGFHQNLRPVSAAVESHLRSLRDAIDAGEDDGSWIEEQMQGLLAALLQHEVGWRRRSRSLADMGRSSHAELLARVDRAADFIVSCHAQPLTLDDIAAAARLSKYHLVRVFRIVLGETPAAFLAAQRARTAAVLARRTELPLEEIAAMAGFGSRQSMYRHLRRQHGAGAEALRDVPRRGLRRTTSTAAPRGTPSCPAAG
jgi:AraC-like DNA-binding protein